MNKQLAKIEKASLEIKERGILNFWLYVKYEEGGNQGVGGISLDTWDEGKKSRVGTAYGCEVIRRLLLCLKVNDFSEMGGKMVWVIGTGSGLGFTPKGIESLSVDGEKQTVIFADILEEFGD